LKLEHSFTVPADLETVWQAVLDPERVAPCMPGATLDKVDGDAFTGSVKVKVGPISLLYKGSGEFLEKDETERRVVIKAAGKDSRGNGTAAATVTVTLAEDGDSTTGSVSTDLSITGKPAQFGRGLISEVGGKILNAFAACLATKLGPEPAPEPEPVPPKLAIVHEEERQEAVATGAAAGAATAKATKQAKAAKAAKAAKDSPKPKLAAVHREPEAEPIDLLAYAGPSVVKRVAPLVAGLVALLVVLGLRRRRG
jgi:carbon monoxide dehydrogenase subunit G